LYYLEKGKITFQVPPFVRIVELFVFFNKLFSIGTEKKNGVIFWLFNFNLLLLQNKRTNPNRSNNSTQQ